MWAGTPSRHSCGSWPCNPAVGPWVWPGSQREGSIVEGPARARTPGWLVESLHGGGL